jgi:hypothetical protein
MRLFSPTKDSVASGPFANHHNSSGGLQPFHEAKRLRPREPRGSRPLALQVSDGENDDVMMNEFPGHYRRVWDELDGVLME